MMQTTIDTTDNNSHVDLVLPTDMILKEWMFIHKRGEAHRSLTNGTSSKRAHEQSTTANPFLLIKL
jgi:hypothetical protein